jgi:hypothetical protein
MRYDPRPIAENVMDDELSKLSAEDRAKIALLEKEWERDGAAAIRRFAEKEPLTWFRLVGLYYPEAVKRALEEALIDKDLTNADVYAMLDKALRERKHQPRASRESLAIMLLPRGEI